MRIGKAKTFKPETATEWRALQIQIKHTFTPHQPIKETEAFVGRERLVEKVVDAIVQPGRHAILYGDRGVGKSSFANLLGHWLSEAGLNLQVVRKPCSSAHTFGSLWHYLLEAYEFVTTDGGRPQTAKAILGANPNPYDVFSLIALLDKRSKYVFIVDEFDRLPHKKAKVLTSDLIKMLSDELENVTIVIVGVAKNVSELFQGHPSLPRSVQQIQMPHMSDEEVREIIESRLPLIGMSMTNSARDTIVRLCQGFPGYAHLLAQHAALAAVRRRSVDIVHGDLDSALSEIVADVHEEVAGAYDKAVQSSRANQYKDVLLACAMAKSDERGRFRPSDVGGELRRFTGKDVGPTSYQRNLLQFCTDERGPTLVQEGTRQNYRYYFDYPLLKPYVILRGLAEKRIEPKHLR